MSSLWVGPSVRRIDRREVEPWRGRPPRGWLLRRGCEGSCPKLWFLAEPQSDFGHLILWVGKCRSLNCLRPEVENSEHGSLAACTAYCYL